MSNKNKEKSNFVEIRDVLKDEVQRLSSINTVLLEGTSEFNKIDDLYSSYGSEMDISKNHIIKLKRREFFENLFVYIGLVIYFACVAYVMLKRFPLHRIIFFVYYILEVLLTWLFSIKEYIIVSMTNIAAANYTQGNITFTNN